MKTRHCFPELSPIGLCIVALVASLTGLLHASPSDQSFGGNVEVTVVNLNVWVRDGDDRPITGLGAGDFEVFENGEPVEISHFFEVRPSPPENVAVAEPATRTGTPRVEAREAARLVIFVDDENLRSNRRNSAFDEISGFLDTEMVESNLQVTVLRSSRGLKWVLEDSRDPKEITAALDGMRSGTGGSVFNAAEFRMLVQDLQNTSSFSEARALVRQFAQSRRLEARLTLLALRAAVTVLSGPDASTFLLYVGNGFPVEPGGDAFYLLDELYPGRGALTEITDYQLRPELEELVELANAGGITVSAYDALGLDIGTATDVDGPAGLGGVQGFRLDSLRRSSRQAPMATLTDATGGLFARSDNTMGELLNAVNDDLKTYYSLGFTSRSRAAKAERTIKVRTTHPGADVRHKRSFTPRSPAEQRSDQTLAALFLEPQENRLELGVRIQDAEKKSRRRFVLPLDILIPFHNLLAEQLPEGERYRLELLFASTDERGVTSPVQRLELAGLKPKLSGAKVPVLSHRVELQLEPGEHRIAVTAHDQVGGLASSVSGGVSIP